jgi:hypothetical protein
MVVTPLLARSPATPSQPVSLLVELEALSSDRRSPNFTFSDMSC